MQFVYYYCCFTLLNRQKNKLLVNWEIGLETFVANADISDMLASYLEITFPSFEVVYKGGSYQDCLEASIQNRAKIYLLQATYPIAHVDDLLFALQGSGISPVYILFEVYAPGQIRYSSTTSVSPLAAVVNEMFQKALKDNFELEHISLRSTLLNNDICPSPEAAGRHESLLEILRGCKKEEFVFYREKIGLKLKDSGYSLFFWELMGFEFNDHEFNKYIYNFSGEMLLRECSGIINEYNEGEVFYSTPNLLCIILNDLDTKNESANKALFEEMIMKLAHCTGNNVACRYLSNSVSDVSGLRYAYERYNTEKSISFFVRDMCVIRPALIEARKQRVGMKTINELLHRITDFLRYTIPAQPQFTVQWPRSSIHWTASYPL